MDAQGRRIASPGLNPLDFANKKVAETIASFIKEIGIHGPVCGAIVNSNQESVDIIVSFRADDEELFYRVVSFVEKLVIPVASEISVQDVTKAIDKEITITGFQGPP